MIVVAWALFTLGAIHLVFGAIRFSAGWRRLCQRASLASTRSPKFDAQRFGSSSRSRS